MQRTRCLGPEPAGGELRIGVGRLFGSPRAAIGRFRTVPCRAAPTGLCRHYGRRYTQFELMSDSDMKPKTLTAVGLACVAVASCVLTGCGNSASGPRADASTDGAKYLLSDEPADARGVVEIRKAIEESGKPAEVVVVGRVGGLGQPTWDPDRASFMIGDLSLKGEEEADHDGAPKHDADACPFCRAKKKKQAAGLAMIEIVDRRGEIPSVDARDLLGLSEGQTIVLRGSVELNSLGNLIVRTSGIYVRP